MYKKGSNNYKQSGYSKINASKYQSDIKTFSIDKFLGVDFTKGEYITDTRRSPDAVNTIWGENPYAFSNRRGKKQMLSSAITDGRSTGTQSNVIYGIHYIESTNEVLVHIGNAMRRYTLSNGVLSGNGDRVCIHMNEAPSTSFYFDGILYILDGKHYWMYSGSTLDRVSINAYVPTTIKSGIAYEKVNLLTRKRINMFCPKTIYSSCEYLISDGTAESGTQNKIYTLKYESSSGVISNLPSDRFDAIDSILVNGIQYVSQYTIDTTGAYAKVKFNASTFESTDKIVIKTYIWDNTFTLDCKNAKEILVQEYNIATNTWTTLTLTTHYTIVNSDSYIKIVLVDSKTQKSELGNEGIDTIKVSFIANDQVHYQGFSNVGASRYALYFDVPNNRTISDNSLCKLYGLNGGVSTQLNITSIERQDNDQVKVIHSGSSYTGYRFEYDYVYNDGSVIDECTIYGIYGGENDMRVFFSGNPSAANKDWYCGLYDPTYFPDLGYTYIGIEESAIMGYIKQYDTQIVIKQSSQSDTSAWLRTYEIDSNGNPKFPIEQGSVGIGAISSKTFGYLNTNPLFLSTQGLMKLAGTNVDYQRLVQCVSEKINSKLLQEANLENAIGVEYKDKYYLFINGHVYVCDARMLYEDALGISEYEWMYWIGINATSVKVCGEYLLFGYQGMIYRLKTVGEENEFQDDDYLKPSTNNLFNELNNSNAFDQLISSKQDGIYKWIASDTTSPEYHISLYTNNFYKIKTIDYVVARTTSDIDDLKLEDEDTYIIWDGTDGATYSQGGNLIVLFENCLYLISNHLLNGASIGYANKISSENKIVLCTNVTNTWQSHEVIAYWVTPKFTLGSIAYKKKFRNLYMLFNKVVSVKCKVTANVDSNYSVDCGQIERLNMSEYDTAVYNERINIEKLDNISLKLEKVLGGATQNASFGIEILQIEYQYKNN